MPRSIALTRHTRCRVCQNPLELVLDLGELRLNGFPRPEEDLDDAPRVPHQLAVCRGCSLAQLTTTVDPDALYRTYWYQSAINESMIRELRAVVAEALCLVEITRDDWVLDIGANDGTLLASYEDLPVRPTRAAVDPATNLHPSLQAHCEILIPDYFPTDHLDPRAGSFKIITAVACAYDLEDPVGFFRKISTLLHPEGLAVVQFQDLGQQIEAAAFDNIVPEHLEYYTLGSLMRVLERASLQAVRCTPTPINGGSLRVLVRKTGDRYRPDQSIYRQLQVEQIQGLLPDTIRRGDLTAFSVFRRRVENATRQILATLELVREQGMTVDLWGASTKANVTLQVLGLGPGEIRQALDRDPRKKGRRTITGIPIQQDTDARGDPAAVWLMGAWQFRESALKRERWYLRQGGVMLFPLPAVELINEGRGHP